MDDEVVDEIFLKDIDMIRVVREKTIFVEELAKQWFRREYRKCVLEDKVDLGCLKMKEKKIKVFFKCATGMIFGMCSGYKECLDRCFKERNDRVFCFENCKDTMIKVIMEADYEQLTEVCVEKSFAE